MKVILPFVFFCLFSNENLGNSKALQDVQKKIHQLSYQSRHYRKFNFWSEDSFIEFQKLIPPQNTCSLNEKIYCDQSSQHNQAFPISQLSSIEIKQLFQQIKNISYFPSQFIFEGCVEKALASSYFLHSKNVSSGQIVIQGQLQSSLTLGFDIHWQHHMATYVYNENGQRIVLDPSLSDEPLSEQNWKDLFDSQNITSTSYHKPVYFMTDAEFSWNYIESFPNIKTLVLEKNKEYLLKLKEFEPLQEETIQAIWKHKLWSENLSLSLYNNQLRPSKP